MHAERAVEVAPRRQMGRGAKRIAVAAVLVLSVAGGSLAFVKVKPEDIPFEQRDWLVIAETPRSNLELGGELVRAGVAFHQIGDCVAPRRAGG